MKQYADLHLQPNLDRRENIEKMMTKASDLGFNLVGVSFTTIPSESIISFLEKTCADCNLDFATRIDLTPKSPKGLLRFLRQYRRQFELVSVNCFSKSVARQAAKDHRVDLLVFPSYNPHERFFDGAEAKLASQGVAALEIDMALLLRLVGFSRVRLLSCLRRELTIAEKLRIPVVICGGATDPYQMRGPYEFASLATLFGMSNASALKGVSETPLAIVERNRRKLDSSYVCRGIRVVQRGKDCIK